ncbi:MAG TPA: hypothetical protein VMT91_12515 [Anaerolineales bacterium]|nr:hypothetical protein [Anaerolineales bacterium]
MKIGCLGWGSLIWDPQNLPVQKHWFCDGPLLPIEFTRHSSKDRITLVLTPGAAIVRSLWTLMLVNDLDTAKVSLAKREGIPAKNIQKDVGYCFGATKSDGESSDVIAKWASYIGLDAVVWTALPPKFDGQDGKIPAVEGVISFLRHPSQEFPGKAEEYIRMTPRQIDTEYRRLIEAELGWTSIGEI